MALTVVVHPVVAGVPVLGSAGWSKKNRCRVRSSSFSMRCFVWRVRIRLMTAFPNPRTTAPAIAETVRTIASENPPDETSTRSAPMLRMAPAWLGVPVGLRLTVNRLVAANGLPPVEGFVVDDAPDVDNVADDLTGNQCVVPFSW